MIVNALRALRGGYTGTPSVDVKTDTLPQRFSAEHQELRDDLSMIRDVAHVLLTVRTTEAVAALRCADEFCQQRLLPHEHDEDRELYPALAAPLGSAEATATMSRMHAEIDRLARRLHAHRLRADAAGAVTDDQVEDLLGCLYGLHALLSLHFVQEEENFLGVMEHLAGPQAPATAGLAHFRVAPRRYGGPLSRGGG